MARPRALERLCSSGPSHMADARAHLTAVVLAARALATYTAHPTPPASCARGCADRRCPLLEVELGAEMCAVAHRLADVPVDVPAHVGAVGATPDLGQLVARFRLAAIASLDAVRTCRQTAHPNGECWFAPDGGRDGCADVLRLAHHF